MSAAVESASLERGFGPQWWSSGVRTWRWWAYGAVTIVLQACNVFQTTSQLGSNPVSPITPGMAWFGAFAALAEVVVGLLFWMWRPGNVIGPLLLTYLNVMTLAEDSPNFFPHSPFVWTINQLFNWAFLGMYVWVLYSFPSGRIWNRAAAWFAVALTIFYCMWLLPDALFVSSPRTLVYVGHGWSGLGVYAKAWQAVALAAWTVVTVSLAVRVAHAAPGARRRLIPLYVLMGPVVWVAWLEALYATFTGDSMGFGPDWLQDSTPYWVNSAIIPLLSAIGASFGLLRVRQARSSVADLVVELERVEPGGVRETLARTLGDPTLELGLWLPEQGSWVDEQGRELSLPQGGQRGLTFVGERLAVMVHDRDLLDQPRLLEAVGSAGRLALVNERLHAELRAQVAEMHDSRARIVQAADIARRRLECDLRDGAHARLLGFRDGLKRLGGHLDHDGENLLFDVGEELGHALAELRELANGIHPAVLTDRGLDAAVRSLAELAPVEVTVEGCREPLPEPVETAAYFVVSEALANITKYAHASRAWVTVGRDNGHAWIEVRDDGIGGADPTAGSGLRGLADRMDALDGRLRIDSPAGGGTTVLAEIPCR